MAVHSVVQPPYHFRPLHERSWGARQWLRLSCTLVGTFFRVWCCLRIEGDEHIPQQGGVLFASNHVSWLDALLIPYTVMATRGVQIVWAPAKEELFRLPLIGRLITSWGAFPVRRGRGDVMAMRRIMTLLRTGKMMLFPEGTRSLDGRLGPGKRAVGKFIYEVRPVVIPTVVCGTERILPRGAYVPRFRLPICVRYGQPLDLQRYYALPDTKQTAAAIVHEVMAAIAALQQTPSDTVR
jgi:1-acyl-sn-glycerol-3-phosphate acyltransferase